jgi:hypothetical protein
VKTLICVKSCKFDRDRGCHDLVRETWGQDTGCMDLRFFIGHGTGHLVIDKADEVLIDAQDAYKYLPWKTKAICKWALNQGYDSGFFCDTGSFVIPHHLLNYEFNDYAGFWGMRNKGPFEYTASNPQKGCAPVKLKECYPWASGGGYLLSRRAMEIVAANDPFVWAEDLWVGQVLAQNGIFLEDKAHDGFKPYIVDWIHLERNDCWDSLEKREKWMKQKYEEAKSLCEAEGCGSPPWNRNIVINRDFTPDDVGKILQERREMRRKQCKI